MKHSSRIAALLLVCTLSACNYLGIGVTKIGDIASQPARFESKEVRIKGKVVDVNKLPVIDLAYYTVRDDTGEIIVIAHGTLPALDNSVVVKGKVESFAIVQGQSLGLRLSETEQTVL